MDLDGSGLEEASLVWLLPQVISHPYRMGGAMKHNLLYCFTQPFQKLSRSSYSELQLEFA